MTTKKETFASLLKEFEYRYPTRTIFDDFLTLTLCAFSYNPLTGLSHDEELYMQTMEKYKDDTLRHHFPKLLICLTAEMEERIGSEIGTDVLGEFYEQHLYRKGAGQYFTPWHLCSLMAKASVNTIDINATHMPMRILDPCCGSGRMLLASAKENGPEHEYYGIDIDHTCVKMTAINLFLNGMFHSEVMCGDALDPDDFRESYKVSFLPFGVFRVAEKENSWLYMLHKNSFIKNSDSERAPVAYGTPICHTTQLRLF
ncbi:N-6 DNA methylase [Mucilaginibacter sp.]|uniref:HsdM family class I SAM-dependent methyltransferase n=1 Tax=Mucilaginibacter sp. TaxID=1882438 RepID=UPI003267D04E